MATQNKTKDIRRIVNSLYLGRKKTKLHVRFNYLPMVLVIGDNDGISNCEFSRELEITQSCSYLRLKNVIGSGLAYKSGVQYYLTDKGQLLYNSMLSELQPVIDSILNMRK